MSRYKLHIWENKRQLAQELAQRVATQLSLGITKRGYASLALSGGLTPQIFLRELSVINIDWDKILITLVDERFVPLEDPRSNQAFLSKYFFKNKAQKSSFIALYSLGKDLEESIQIANDKIQESICFPFDVVVLGMGTDGHTASFFPQGNTLFTALDANTPRSVIAIKDGITHEQRITMTFSALYDARFLAVHIEGAKKKHTLDQAIAGFDTMKMPIRSILWHAHSLVEIYWAP
ncbi:MAG: 6-phosphogluconolactonase [Candidatus Liberibacter ctenarytainae]|uniref:6-phosphogluconolactonase n=1 Tax=Candidatus Liberibacter ctenarytainae TaxID=2020335 RepID=A0A937AKK3_9HYPH|nr:6-phosphogluconolactonase [Candidatus Liberibacter ctenarytainae]